MTIRFSPHFTLRLKERFPGEVNRNRVLEIVEQGVLEATSEAADDGRWRIHGLIGGKPVRVVYVEEQIGRILLVTAMWVHSHGFRFEPKRKALVACASVQHLRAR